MNRAYCNCILQCILENQRNKIFLLLEIYWVLLLPTAMNQIRCGTPSANHTLIVSAKLRREKCAPNGTQTKMYSHIICHLKNYHIIIIINCFHQSLSSFTITCTNTITYLTVGEHYWADGPFSSVSFSLSGWKWFKMKKRGSVVFQGPTKPSSKNTILVLERLWVWVLISLLKGVPKPE